MRKFLFVVLILLLCVAMFFVVWYDIPGLEIINTYPEVEEAYSEYQKTLKTLETKNNSELPSEEAKLSTEYSKDANSDLDNVIKQYNENKQNYEELVAYQNSNASIGAADIYDIEYIWTTIGSYASNNWLNMTMDVTKSDADLESQDYIMCNLEFEVVGVYQCIAEFIEDIELDSSIGFQINDFFIEGYEKTSRNQTKDKNMDTDNIPSEKDSSEDGSAEYTVSSYTGSSSETAEAEDEHKLDVTASFKVYNVPINRRTITNVKSASTSTTTDEIAEEGTIIDSNTITE